MSCIVQPAVVPGALVFIGVQPPVTGIPASPVAPTIIVLKPATVQGAWMAVRTSTPMNRHRACRLSIAVLPCRALRMA